MNYGTASDVQQRRSSLPNVTRSASLRRRRNQQYLQQHCRHPHSYTYRVLNSSKIKWFNRILALVIVANIIADVLITVPSVQKVYQSRFDLFETASSLFFITEYTTRFVVAGERPKYAGFFGHVRFATSIPSLIDVISFAPWLIEKAVWLSGMGYKFPATGFMRIFRMLRILKTERFVGSVDAISRVVYMNSSILMVAVMMALMLLLLTSSMLYYANRSSGDPQFESIPACLYAAILMLTGQGEPDGDLTEVTKFLCAFTAIFSVAMVAIPASMLTFGFEIEATRLAKKRREARLKRKARIELDDPAIASTSDSESDDAALIRRAQRRRRRKVAFQRKQSRTLDNYVDILRRLPCGCRCCCFEKQGRDRKVNLEETENYDTSLLQRSSHFRATPSATTQGQLSTPPPLFLEELDSSEAEYEELVLGKTEADAYDEVKNEIMAKQREKQQANTLPFQKRRQNVSVTPLLDVNANDDDHPPPLDIELPSTSNDTPVAAYTTPTSLRTIDKLVRGDGP
mmetsp:Transcript_3409/g.4769  ORF Transcript_3409/g.4769 Transcript_3409/m.4769 type:complete len:515 (-) Transcript_3409:316-1860(-)